MTRILRSIGLRKPQPEGVLSRAWRPAERGGGSAAQRVARAPLSGFRRGRRRQAARDFLGQLPQWHDIFRDYAERLFRLSFEVEEKLIHSIALERKGEHREIFERVRQRKGETDQILRAIHWKLRQFQTAPELDTEALYDFCMLAHRGAQFLQFTALALFVDPDDSRAKDPVFRAGDWQELDKLGKNLPSAIRAHYADFREAPPETVEAVVVEPAPAEPVGERPREAGPAAGRRSRRASASPPPDAVAQLERMRRSQTRRRP